MSLFTCVYWKHLIRPAILEMRSPSDLGITSHLDSYIYPFFLLPTQQLKELTVYLLPNAHPLTGAIVKR